MLVTGLGKTKVLDHRRRSLVKYRGDNIFARNVWKIDKMPKFYMIHAQKISKIPKLLIFARKLAKIPNFTRFLPKKCPNFIIAWKIFFPEFLGHMPPSPTPMFRTLEQVPGGYQCFFLLVFFYSIRFSEY